METSQLKRIPLFKDASDQELGVVAHFAEAREVSKGTVLMREEGFSNELMAIEDGTAEVTREGKKIAKLKRGDVFGEAGLVRDEKRSATVTATSPLKLIVLRYGEVARLRARAPEIYGRIEKLIEERGG
jgi:cAMP-dependent protein kinase regulator